MALIKCRECGQLISDRAVVCPNCGCPASSANDGRPVVRWQPEPAVEEPVYYYEEPGGNNTRKWLIGIIVALVVVLVCGGMYYYSLVSERQRLDREKFVADSTEKAKKDSVIAAEKAEQERADSLNQVRLQKMEEERNRMPSYMELYSCVPDKLLSIGLTKLVDDERDNCFYKIYGKNVTVRKKKGYDTEYSFHSKSSHACYVFYSGCGIDHSISICFNNSSDADNFARQRNNRKTRRDDLIEYPEDEYYRMRRDIWGCRHFYSGYEDGWWYFYWDDTFGRF